MNLELTHRDLRVLQALHTHRVLTTPQIGELFFSGPRSRVVQRRLRALEEAGMVEHFLPPHSGGRAPYHWMLADTGARALAEHRGQAPQDFRHRASAQPPLPLNKHLGHITGLAQTYVCFAASARYTQGARLQRWWSEARCRASWGRYVRPDAYLRWQQDDVVLDAFIEYDTGSEPLRRVTAKIDRYRTLAEQSRYRTPVLFIVTGPKRLTNLCASFDRADPSVPVHVTTLDQLTRPGPTRPIWRQAADPTHVVRTLVELA